MSKVCAIIAAAGSGSRMGIGFNKQFIKVNDKPILYYTLNIELRGQGSFCYPIIWPTEIEISERLTP